jgi:hypothetical protein
MAIKWIITVHFEERDIIYTVTKYPTIREDQGVSRVFFIDERTKSPKNFPYNKISIEELRE